MIFNKLIRAEDRFREIEQALTLPEIISNNKEYSSLMKEYKEITNRAITNARQKFRIELNELISAYENNEDITLDQKIFVERFLRSLKLDSSKSTCNMICWEVENVFDGKKSFAPDKVDIYDLLRRKEEYSPFLLDKIVKECKKSEKRRAVKCVIDFLLNKKECEDETDYNNVDFDISDTLSEICSNEEVLCDLLLDYCYRYNGNKEILWSVSGETLLKRLAENHTLHYPILDSDGEFEVQGKLYSMRELPRGGDEDEV